MTTQTDLEGKEVGVQASIAKRTRPQVLIESGPYELKRNARVIANTRVKGPTHMKDKVRVKDSAKETIINYSREELERHMTAVLEAAMHASLPGYDDDWQVIQKGDKVDL